MTVISGALQSQGQHSKAKFATVNREICVKCRKMKQQNLYVSYSRSAGKLELLSFERKVKDTNGCISISAVRSYINQGRLNTVRNWLKLDLMMMESSEKAISIHLIYSKWFICGFYWSKNRQMREESSNNGLNSDKRGDFSKGIFF